MAFTQRQWIVYRVVLDSGQTTDIGIPGAPNIDAALRALREWQRANQVQAEVRSIAVERVMTTSEEQL